MAEKRWVRVKVNGVAYEGLVEPRKLLVDFLRDDLGLTGTHVGCEEGVCGACTILLNGDAVRSCLLFALQADGAELMTVEGLARNGQLHPIQKAFWENHASQCGFCTPGFLMATYHFLQENPAPTEEQIRLSIGNICRCTGYVNIVKAIQEAAVRMKGG